MSDLFNGNTYLLYESLMEKVKYELKKSNKLKDRSYAQYKCQLGVGLIPDLMIFNFICYLAALLICSYFASIYIVNFIFKYRYKYFVNISVGVNKNWMMPDTCADYSLDKKKISLLCLLPVDGKALLYFVNLISTPLLGYFSLKNIVNCLLYYPLVRCNPSKIFASCEYSFSSSILTEFCNLYGVRHVNVTHGEKLFYPRDAFATFDEYIYWDDSMLFVLNKLEVHSLHWICKYPVVPIPKLINWNYRDKINFVYFLQNQNPFELSNISNILVQAKHNGVSVYFKRHPIYSPPLNELMKYGIEVINEAPINSVVIAGYSSILFEKLISGEYFLIDDCTDDGLTNFLKSMSYRFSKDIYSENRLSKFLNICE